MKSEATCHGGSRNRNLILSIPAILLLAACGGRDKSGNDGKVATASRSVTTTPASEAPATAGLPDGLSAGNQSDGRPTLPPIPAPSTQPPTEEETRTAWREGVALYGSGDFDEASVRLQIAAEGRTEDAYVHYLHGLSLWKSGHPKEAETALTRSSELHKGSSRTFINLARVRLELDDPTGALEAADQAIVIEPGAAQALHQRGRALSALKRGDEALDTLQQAHQAEPANGYIANTLGYLLLRQGRTNEAVPLLESARTSLPAVAYVRNNLGVAYERLGEVDKAIAEFQAAVEQGDPDGKAGASLARLEPLAGRPGRGLPGTDDTEQTPVAQVSTDDPTDN